MLIEPKREIMVGPLLRTACLRCWAARDHLIRLGTVPLIAMLAAMLPLQNAMLSALSFAEANGGQQDADLTFRMLLLLLCYAAAGCLFAVNWVRQLTLGADSVPGLGLTLSSRHFRFFFLILAILFVTAIVLVVVALILNAIGIAGVLAAAMMGFLLGTTLIARLSPSWIGIAINAPMPLATAWRRTAGQGFRLVVALLAIKVPVMLVQQMVDRLFALTGLGTAAPMTLLLLLLCIEIIGLALQLALLVAAFPQFLRETV